MNQCTFFPGSEVDFFLTSSSDTSPSLQSNGTNTAAKSSENGQETGSLTCKCTKETLGCSIHPNTPDEYIRSMQAFHARILATLENKLELAKAHEADCIGKSSESLTWYDRKNCSWKTYQRSFLTDWELYSETWPRSAMMQDGVVYELQMLAQITEGIDGGCLQGMWATPQATEGGVPEGEWMGTYFRKKNGKKAQTRLNDQVKMIPKNWPTPATKDYKGVRLPETMELTGRNPETNSLPDAESETSGMRLNPAWVAWLMMFPIGWVNLKD